jgi:hypothetical protein
MKRLNQTVVAILLIGFSTLSFGAAGTKDWPQACYNEVSMWVTEACKEYIETVYYPTLTTTTTDTTTTTTSDPAPAETTFLAGPGPVFGGGIIGVLLIGGVFFSLKRSGLRVLPRHGD